MNQGTQTSSAPPSNTTAPPAGPNQPTNTTGTTQTPTQNMATAVNPEDRERRLGDPAPFKGDSTDKKNARRFLNHCQSNLDINSKIYPNDKDKILYALARMIDGPAGDWANDLIEAASAPGGSYGTWSAFKTQFTNKFITTNEVAEAIHELSTMQQGDRTADDFNNAFQSAVARSGVTQHDVLKSYYENAISRPLLLKIYAKGEAPTDMAGYYKAASNHDNLYRRLKALGGPPTTKTQSLSQRFKPKNRNNYSAPQTTTSFSATSSNPPKLTPEERARCIAQKLCFKCRQPGHTTVNCPRYPNVTGNRPQYPQNIRATEVPAFQQYFTPQGVPYYVPMNPAPNMHQINAVTNQGWSDSQATWAPPPAPSTSNFSLNTTQSPAQQAAQIRALIAGMTEEQQQAFYSELDSTPEGF